ncbi:MAG: hypothetical protein SVK08_02075 [Halobacteriota archaeon]|nr:hypothetical protein [Halobacteriota archaeon]
MNGKLLSSDGSIEFDVKTGDVLIIDSNVPNSYLFDIKRIDVKEWGNQYPEDSISEEHDILDFGFWDKVGNYAPPSTEWRSDRAKEM